MQEADTWIIGPPRQVGTVLKGGVASEPTFLQGGSLVLFGRVSIGVVGGGGGNQSSWSVRGGTSWEGSG